MCQEVSVVYMKLFEYSTNEEISTSKDPMALSFWSWQVMILVGVSIFYNPIILTTYHHFFYEHISSFFMLFIRVCLYITIYIYMHINSSAPKKKKKNFYIDSTKEMPSKNQIGSCFEKPWCFKSTTLLFSSQKKKTLLFSGLFKEEFLSLLIQILFI